MNPKIPVSDLQQHFPKDFQKLKQSILEKQSQAFSFCCSIMQKKGCIFRKEYILVLQKNSQKKQSVLGIVSEVVHDNFPFVKQIRHHEGKAFISFIKEVELDGDVLKIFIKHQLSKEIIEWNCKFFNADVASKWMEMINQQKKKCKSVGSSQTDIVFNQTQLKYRQQLQQLSKENQIQKMISKQLENQITNFKQEFVRYKEYYENKLTKERPEEVRKTRPKKLSDYSNLLTQSKSAKNFQTMTIEARARQQRANEIFKHAENSSIMIVSSGEEEKKLKNTNTYTTVQDTSDDFPRFKA